MRSGLSGMTTITARRATPATTPTTSSTIERSPGIGPLAGWRGADGERHGIGAPNPDQLERYIANGCFWHATPAR